MSRLEISYAGKSVKGEYLIKIRVNQCECGMDPPHEWILNLDKLVELDIAEKIHAITGEPVRY